LAFPHTDQLLLLRFLNCCDFDVEKTHALLKLNLGIRHQWPQVFANRDINSSELQNVISFAQICPMPIDTKEKHKVTIFRFIDDSPDKYDFVNYIKMLLITNDVRNVTLDSFDVSQGEVCVMDCEGFSFKHFLKVATNLSVLKMYLNYVQTAVPFKIVANHFVNCSPILTKMMTLMKPFINRELYEAMHFHTDGYQSLHKMVSKEFLPTEYGGTAGLIDAINRNWMKNIEQQRDYVVDDSNWTVNDFENLQK